MSQSHSADAHAERVTREIVDNALNKLKEWLDKRLRSQEELLRSLSNDRRCRLDIPKLSQEDPLRMAAASFDELKREDPLFEEMRVRNASETSEMRVRNASEASEMRVRDASEGEIRTPSKQGSKQLSARGQPTVESRAELETIPVPGSIDTCSAIHAAVVHPPHEAPVVLGTFALPGCTAEVNNDSDEDQPSSVPRSDTMVAHINNGATSKDMNAANGTESLDEVPEAPMCPKAIFGQNWQSKLMDVFDQLDLDGSGSIDRQEFATAFEEVGLPKVRAFEVFGAMDKTENMMIDRIEWLHIIEEATRSSHEEVEMLIKFIERLANLQATKGHIYATDHRKKTFLILRHDSPKRMAWDVLMMILLFYISMTLPYSLGFGATETIEKIDTVFDILFCVDVMLNFRTTYADRDDAIVCDGGKIACQYVKTWFFLDFFSSCPFELVTAGLMPNLTPARLLKIGKIAKVTKLLRFGKMGKNLAGSELSEKLEERSSSGSSQTLGRLVQLGMVTVVLAHWLACFGSFVDSGSLDTYFVNRSEVPTRFQKYLAAVYWAMTTLSTVGYGDITPTSDAERAYTMFAMVIGGAFYGYIIGSVTSIVSDMDLNARAFYSRMDLVQAWLDSHTEVPKLLRRRVRKHFKFALAQKSAMDDSDVLSELSPELRADMAFFILSEHVRCNPMFSDIPNGALANLVYVVHKNHSNANEFIVRSGDPGIAMYILVEGVARYDEGFVWRPKESEVPESKFQKLMEGASFGEEIIFELEENYKYSIIAISSCEFHSIPEDGFKDQYRNMPELHKQMYTNFLKSRRTLDQGTPDPADGKLEATRKATQDRLDG